MNMTTGANVEVLGCTVLYFSYSQVIAFDDCETQPGSLWTVRHVKQGFVRRPHSVGIGMISEYGEARLRVYNGKVTRHEEYDRIVSVPIEIVSGVLHFEGPEECNVERVIHLNPGTYTLCVAQCNEDNFVRVDVFVESVLGNDCRSSIIKADSKMATHSDLLEDGEVAR